MTKRHRIVFRGTGLKILVIHLHQAIAMITDERNANVRIKRQKRTHKKDIALPKHAPVLTVKICAPLEAAVIFVNKQIHFIIHDIRFLLMQVPLVMPVTLLSCMACTFKMHNLLVAISQICIIRQFQFLCLFTFQMFMVHSRGKLALQVTQCQLLKGFLAPKMKRSKIKMSGVL